jgi:hypothetical protein
MVEIWTKRCDKHIVSLITYPIFNLFKFWFLHQNLYKFFYHLQYQFGKLFIFVSFFIFSLAFEAATQSSSRNNLQILWVMLYLVVIWTNPQRDPIPKLLNIWNLGNMKYFHMKVTFPKYFHIKMIFPKYIYYGETVKCTRKWFSEGK